MCTAALWVDLPLLVWLKISNLKQKAKSKVHSQSRFSLCRPQKRQLFINVILFLLQKFHYGPSARNHCSELQFLIVFHV